MKNQDSNLKEEIASLLGVGESFSLIELYDKLKEYRNEHHPDKYNDDEAKLEAESKFKNANNLLNQVRKQIEKNKLSSTSTELTLYKPIFDNFASDQELENAKKKIDELEDEVVAKKNKIESLEKELELRSSKNLSDEISELENMYMPSKRRVLTTGIAFFLTSLIIILSKVEDISNIIMNYSPVSETTFNISTFAILLLIILISIKRYTEQILIKKRASEIISPSFVKKFMNKINNEDINKHSYRSKKFLESHVFEFILGNENKFKNFLSNCGLRYFQYGTIDQLKNIFIENLLNKKLVKISHAKDLDRVFIIKNEE